MPFSASSPRRAHPLPWVGDKTSAVAHAQVGYNDISSASLKMHRDGSGTFTLTKVKVMYLPQQKLVFDRVRDVKGCVRVLAKVLPDEVAADAGFMEG